MAVNEVHVSAPPERCFEVLSDPRSFGHWVVGSRRIRAVDPDWPAVGTAFDHTAGVGPFLTHDRTEVEKVEENRLLCLRAKARPFGTAYVKLELEPEDGGTRVRIREEPGDDVTGTLFGPLTDRLVRARNERGLARFKALAEGTAKMPDGKLPLRHSEEARSVAPLGRGAVGAAPETLPAQLAAGFGRGFAAGMVGAAAMSVSTAVEMRLSKREASDVPAQVLQRALGLRRLSHTAERRLTTTAHVATGAMVGGARGMLSVVGLRSPYGAPVAFAIAMTPEMVVVPALGIVPPPWRWSKRELAVSVLHHGVFATATSLAFARLER